MAYTALARLTLEVVATWVAEAETPTTERCTLAGGNYTHTRLMDGNPFASMATCAAPERGDLCAAARAGAAGRLPGFAEVSAVRGMALR